MKYKPFFILTIACLMSSVITLAQNIDILKKSEFQPEQKDKRFAFIASTTDAIQIQSIATIKATTTSKKQDVEVLYYKLKEKAQQLGANSFKLNSFQTDDSTGKIYLILDTYYLTDSALQANAENYEKNVIYIFGDSRKSDKTYSFKINNVKTEIKGGTFYKYQNKEGQEAKINKGGFAGATTWIRGNENRPATFLTLTGFGLGGGPVPVGQVGVSFNTGRINYVDSNLGYLLISILTPDE